MSLRLIFLFMLTGRGIFICNGGKMKFLKEPAYIKYFIVKTSSKTTQIPFTENSLKIKKGLKLVSRPHFSDNFLIKFFRGNIS